MTAEQIRTALNGDVSVNSVDVYVEKSGLLSTDELLAAKKEVSGLQVADPASARPVAVFQADVARKAGAIALDGPTPVVAFIEDLPFNISTVSQALQRDDFEVVLMTASQFSKWSQELYSATGNHPHASSIGDIFDAALATDASDIHLSAGKAPKIRIRGEIRSLPFQELTSEWLHSEFHQLVGEFKMNELAETHNCDAACSYGNVRFRVNLGNSTGGMTAAIRRLPADIPAFDDIGLPPAVRKMCELERGLVLVTGPTGLCRQL